MPDELRDRVMRDVSTVEWPDGRTIRRRAGLRRVRRLVAGGVAVVAAVAAVWTVVPAVGDGGPFRPADDPARAPAAGLLRPGDVGPSFEIGAWGSYESTEGGKDTGEAVAEWPATWLTGCPAYATAPPVGFRGHRGGSMVRADAATGPPVTELVMRFADAAAAGAVLAEARQVAAACATYDVDGRQRYTVTAAAEGFAGDEAVRLDLTGGSLEHVTGGRVGVPGLEVYVLVRVGRTVILLTGTGSIDAPWLQSLAPTAVRRLCAETDEC